MADKNGNGIDDRLEGGLSAGARKKTNSRTTPYGRGSYVQDSLSYKRPSNPNTIFANSSDGLPEWLLNPIRQLDNFQGDLFNFSGEKTLPGQGRGDYIWGTAPGTKPNNFSRMGSGRRQKNLSSSPVEETSNPSFLANLMEALGIVGDGGQMGYVSYDPLRADANSRGTEYDARLNAMYNQLQGSIRDDGTSIQSNYQGAIDQNAARSAETQKQIQGASDAAQASNMQQLQALGLGEAAGNIVSKGQDLNTQTAAAVQDAAARGQISGDALQQNQQSAGAHNTNLVGAAGLEGNLQRARVQSELASLLAQYDMEEQQANQQVDQYNAQARNNSFSQAMSLAQQLYGSDIDQRDYNDRLAQLQYEMANQSQQQVGPDSATLQYLMQILGQDADPELLFKGYEALRPRS